MEWQTKLNGKQYMCSDIALMSGKISDCSGQCMNGGVCLNGKCECRKGYSGDFCQVVEYVPVKTNYTKYLKIFLLYVIMILIIIALLVGAYFLFKNAKEYFDNLDLRPRLPADPDDISGAIIDQDGSSRHRFGNFDQ